MKVKQVMQHSPMCNIYEGTTVCKGLLLRVKINHQENKK